MYNRGLKFFLMFIISMLTFGCFIAFADGAKNVCDVLSSIGFNEKTDSPYGEIHHRGVGRDMSLDVLMMIDRLKDVTVDQDLPMQPADYTIYRDNKSSTDYVIHLSNSTSFSSDWISISVDNTGNGFVQYMGQKRAFFKSVDFYKFCATVFNKSKLLSIV